MATPVAGVGWDLSSMNKMKPTTLIPPAIIKAGPKPNHLDKIGANKGAAIMDKYCKV